MTDLRLDLFVKKKLNISRQKAQELISKGDVKVNNAVVNKPSHKVSDLDSITIINAENTLKYVGRGGYKLEKAVCEFNIDIQGICIDIGASTGGFTDCMLQKGAQLVYAVDVGSNQLAEKLREDKRVISMENCDIRQADLPEADFIGCDVSFISLDKIFPAAYKLLKDDGKCVFLIKPQFEAGKGNISKKGVVKNPKVHKAVIRNVIDSALKNGIYVKAITYSPIKGGDGNIEYLILADKIKDKAMALHNIDLTVESAYAYFSNR